MRIVAWVRNVVARIKQFLRDTRSELKKVIWPSWQNTWLFAGVVVISIVAVGVVLWGTDALLALVLRLLVKTK